MKKTVNKILLFLIALVLTGCATPSQGKYFFCQYPTMNCEYKHVCHTVDPRLNDVREFCMPTELIEALDLQGYK